MLDRFVLFGASGDLTTRLLLPAMAELMGEGRLPAGLRMTGVGRSPWSTDEFRLRMRRALAEHATGVEETARERLVAMLDYRAADVTDPAAVSTLLNDIHRPLLAYLALPPPLFEGTIAAISAASLAPGSAIAIEKPFGTGLASARRLNATLREELPGLEVYRVDHLPSSELVQRVSTLRFANRIFEPVWNSQHIERVEIIWDETLTLENRATYYDGAGALRDMIQNHLLQVLCVVAMDPPARFDERSVRDCRAEVLRAIPSPSLAHIRRHCCRARYTAGRIGRRTVPSYVDEPGIDHLRMTETFAQVTVEVDTWRWEGTPFVLRSGKALAEDRAEVALHFRAAPPPANHVRQQGRNVLRIGLFEPYVRLEINDIGPNRSTARDSLQLSEDKPSRSAYANLLLDMLHGEPMLMTRDDEAEEQWRIVEPVLDAWAANTAPLLEYPAGSGGPAC
jgi:glucose-6-phosphate 1-dehydrogenase